MRHGHPRLHGVVQQAEQDVLRAPLLHPGCAPHHEAATRACSTAHGSVCPAPRSAHSPCGALPPLSRPCLPRFQVDHLYIDLNGVLHNALRQGGAARANTRSHAHTCMHPQGMHTLARTHACTHTCAYPTHVLCAGLTVLNCSRARTHRQDMGQVPQGPARVSGPAHAPLPPCAPPQRSGPYCMQALLQHVATPNAALHPSHA